MFVSKDVWRQSASVFLLLMLGFTTVAARVAPQTATGTELDTFYDNFNNNSIGTSLWSVGAPGSSDPQIAVSETGGQLAITPRANQTGEHYNGLISSRTYNFTAGIIFTEVVEISQASAKTILAFGADNNNKISMRTEAGNLHMWLAVGGNSVGATSIPYNSAAHRWWRIRHVQAGDTIRFDTSPDGIVWTQRHSIGRGSLNITAGKVSISAGTSNAVASPGRARFDNLSWHPLVPNEGDWSAPTTALTANPTPGTWDHILWGAASPSTMVKFNGTYFLYYIGARGETGEPLYEAVNRSLGVATSSNGVNFTKYTGNPIITYTTTGGTVPYEGVGSATAIVVGNTIHLYYGAIRSIGGNLVDIDIRYRKSTDGYNFTNDTLIYRSAGNEYSPLGVTNVGTSWSVYIKGPLTDGLGALSRLSGTSPTSLPTKTNVTSTTFGSGGNANFINGNLFVMHLERRQSTEDRFQVRIINTSAPNALSDPLFSYTFGNFGDHANPATFRDAASGKWFMYTLNLTTNPATISARTYTPPNIVVPTSTPLATLSRTPTPTRTPAQVLTNTATPIRTSTSVVTFTRTPTPGGKATPVGSSQSLGVSDLDARLVSLKGTSAVEVTVTLYDDTNTPIPNAQVTGTFSNGYDGTGTCVTDHAGVCTIVSGSLPSGIPAVTFTITGVSHSNLLYNSSSNRDSDGESNGTTITIPIS